MSRPPLEVADVVRQHGAAFLARYGHTLSGEQHRALRAIETRSEPDQELLVGAESELVMGEGIQEQFRCAHDEIGINGFALRDLRRDPLEAILVTLGVDGCNQRGAAPYQSA